MTQIAVLTARVAVASASSVSVLRAHLQTVPASETLWS